VDSFSDSGLLQFILLAAGMFLLGRIITHFSHQQNEGRQREIWQEFAQENNLRFTPASFFNGSNVCINGQYQGYRIELFTTSHQRKVNNKTQDYTCTHANLLFEQHNLDDEEIVIIEQLSPKKYVETHIIKLLFPNGLICRHRNNFQITIEAGMINYQHKGGIINYQHEGFEENKDYLARLADMLCDLADNCAKVVFLGGEVVPALQAIIDRERHPLGSIALYLLEAIALQSHYLKDTKPNLFCPHCLEHYETQKIRLPRQLDTTYFACPVCHQNRNHFAGQVVVLLDSQMEKEQFQTEDMLKVNWFAHREVFDFDAIEIERATDEDVERFAVQMGNDTNESRRLHYRKMSCVISPMCQLSENTIRILEHLVGSVEIKASANLQ